MNRSKTLGQFTLFAALILCFCWVGGALAEGEAKSGESSKQDKTVQELKDSLDKGFQQVEEMKKKLEEMAIPIQNILKGVADKDVLQAISDLLHKSNWPLFWWSQLGAFLSIILLRSWLISRSTKWFRRLWTDVWTMGLYLFLLFIAVPMVTIGEPYRKITKAAWDIYRAL
ncbi:MAG: hypothetical protein KDD43_01840 [Bdellovibrionales bacterium]|nr:hypothetical protein [Bdellovibrionales bacterium]